MKKPLSRSASEALQYSLRQQELVSEIALEMNSLKSFPDQVNRTLRKIGTHTGVSRVYIFEDSPDGVTSSNTYEWCNEGIDPQIKNLQNFPYAIIPSWKHFLENEGRVYSEDVTRLPADLQEALEPQEVQSIIAYPLYVQQKFFGFIGFDECVRKKRWSRQELELLRTLSGIVANAYERKAMEVSLRRERDKANEANRAKTLFLASISHEIRSPMHAVLGFSEALLHELPDEQQRKMAQSIITSGNLLLSLLNDILDLSKIEAGRMEIVPGPVQLKQLLEEIRNVFELQASKKGIALQLLVDDALPDVVLVDRVRIKQVVFNLLGNAIKFTNKGEVRMTVSYTTPHPQRDVTSVNRSANMKPQPQRGDMPVEGEPARSPQPQRGDMPLEHPDNPSSQPQRDGLSGTDSVDMSSPVKGEMSVDRTAHMKPEPQRGDMPVEGEPARSPQPQRGDMSVEGEPARSPQPQRGDMSVEGVPKWSSQPQRGETSVHPAILILEVSDTGIGIPLEEQERIFDPFVQAPGVAGGGYGGTGLGLSICKRLVEQMHGKLVVKSRLGKGSVFTATIPCSEP